MSPVLWSALACDWALERKKELREARRVVVWKFCGGRRRRRRRSWSRWTDADAGGLAFSDELRVFLSFSWKRKAKERRRSLHDLERRERENAVLFFPPFAFPRRSSSSSSSSSARQQRRATNFNLRARHGAACACAISSQPDRRTDGHALYLLSNSKPREERRGSTHSHTRGGRDGGGEGGTTTIEYSHIYESPPRVMPLPLSLPKPQTTTTRPAEETDRDRDRRLPLSSFLPLFSHTHLAVHMHSVCRAHTHSHTACPVQNGTKWDPFPFSPKRLNLEKARSVGWFMSQTLW